MKQQSVVIKSTGKISVLREKAFNAFNGEDMCKDSTSFKHVGIGHTRWATVSPWHVQLGAGGIRRPVQAAKVTASKPTDPSMHHQLPAAAWP
jgi:hypothetical protein